MIKIVVSAEDIKNGKAGGAHSCAVANALIRQFEVPYGHCAATRGYIRLPNSKRYKTSIRLSRFIDRFDSGQKVKPSTFRLYDTLHRID